MDVVLTHPDISQLYIALLHGDRQVDLAQVDTTTGIGTLCPGAGTPGLNVIFDDAGVTPVCTNAVLTGNILPFMPLGLFDNGSTADVWTLGVFDGATGQTGSIQQWSLHFRRQSCPPQPTGACCVGQTCTPGLTAAACTAQSGTYQGDGSTCTPNPCLPATGACCIHSSCTANMTATACTTAGGVFQGGGTTCTPIPCVSCAGDADCSGSVNFNDINYFVAALAGAQAGWEQFYASQNGGQLPPCPYLNNDVNQDTRVTFDDIPAFVDKLVAAAQCP